MSDREKTEKRPTHSIEPGEDKRRPSDHEVNALSERNDDEGRGETIQRQE